MSDTNPLWSPTPCVSFSSLKCFWLVKRVPSWKYIWSPSIKKSLRTTGLEASIGPCRCVVQSAWSLWRKSDWGSIAFLGPSLCINCSYTLGRQKTTWAEVKRAASPFRKRVQLISFVRPDISSNNIWYIFSVAMRPHLLLCDLNAWEESPGLSKFPVFYRLNDVQTN